MLKETIGARRAQYFSPADDDPAPLTAVARREVRFAEVDALQIVWHGHYLDYFEDARVALGERYGIGYMDFFHAGLITPLVQAHVDYFHPLSFRQQVRIEARLHWCEAVRLNHSYRVIDERGRLAAAGYTVQLVQDRERATQLIRPPFMEAFWERWRSGAL
jgi:acyl-CoA thioester hydrolase